MTFDVTGGRRHPREIVLTEREDWEGRTEPDERTAPQSAPQRVVCLTDCRPGGEHLPACPMYLPALVKTHPAVAELRDALAAYAGLMNSSPHGRDWEEMWAGNHGRLAAAAEQARVLLDRIAGGTA